MVKYVNAGLQHLSKMEALEKTCFTTDAFHHRQLRNLVLSQNAIMLLATDGDDVIGSCIGLTQRRGGSITGRIYSLCVREDYRHKNIATTLLTQLENILAEKGAKRITLEVREDNVPARRFYLKNGFLEKHIIASYYQDGVNAVKMKKCLKYSIKDAIFPSG